MQQDQEGYQSENYLFRRLIDVRLATLLEQIIAFNNATRYNIAEVRSTLDNFGYEVTIKQEEIYSLLQELIKPIKCGDIEAVLADVVSSAKAKEKQIQKLFLTRNPKFYKLLDEALNGGDYFGDKAECMKALIVELVNLIVSLFGVRFQQLISHASQYVLGETFEVNLNIASQILSQATMNEADKRGLEKSYKKIVSTINFEYFFPSQPWMVIFMLVHACTTYTK